MSYQVLARKWRPKIFSEVIGQQHVLQALINALTNQRLHHAYLFSGTRGVGKTTLARIFAKSLNCEKGITPEPCGVCGPCTEIDEGRFVDLIEVDAASRTKVEDTRELLENVQYAPSRGRFKVYLIDEVHMLSNHSFNALLKTLEEPPPHVKFLLATTDPQKLPVTVLSRCLQFNLMNMSAENIVTYLTDILAAESIPSETSALWQIGRAAEGSMRDALSLTDQAIAYSNGDISDTAVSKMLGSLDKGQVQTIVHCLTRRDAADLLKQIAHWADFSPDFHQLLTELLSLLHRIAIAQIVPGAVDNSFGDRDQILEMAANNTAEDIQLFYQMGMIARKDLALAPDARSGFEMALLRMMVFSPDPVEGELPPMPASSIPDEAPVDQADGPVAMIDQADTGNIGPRENAGFEEKKTDITSAQETPNIAPAILPEAVTIPVEDTFESSSPVDEIIFNQESSPAEISITESPSSDLGVVENHNTEARQSNIPDQKVVNSSAETVAEDTNSPETVPEKIHVSEKKIPESISDLNWPQKFWELDLDGMTESIFGNASWKLTGTGSADLVVDSDYETLYSQTHLDKLLQKIKGYNKDIQSIDVQFGTPGAETPFMYRARNKEESRLEAVAILKADPFIHQLEQEFGGKLDETSIKPRIH